jgi:hypothetical protein
MLDEEQLKTLAAFLNDAPSFSVTSANLQRTLSISTTDANHLAGSLKVAGKRSGSRSYKREIAIALESIAASRQLSGNTIRAIEVVCTAPSRLCVPVRATFATAIEMIQAARQEIFVVSYVFTEGAKEIVEQLANARRDRGVSVTLIGNRMQNHLPALRFIWPATCPKPTVFSREADPNDHLAALHAKLLICDSNVALVTSANFSFHGLHENIEIGVKIESAAVSRLVEFIRAMIAGREVETVKWVC